MKQIKLWAAGAALCALCITGCSNEMDQTSVQAGKQVTMTMQAAGPQPRADYIEEGNVMKFSWRKNDAISVVVNGVPGNENCRLSTTKAGKSVSFSGTVTAWEGTKDIYAFYPSSTTGYTVAGGDNSATADLTLPNPQTYTVGGAITNSFMVGTGTATATDQAINASASMKQVMSIIKLKITNAPALVTDVKLKCTEAVFPTTATVTLSTAEITNPGKLTKELAMNVTDDANSSKEVSFAMFPTNLTGKEIEVEITFAGGKTKTIKKQGINFERNVHYTMNFDASPSMAFKINPTSIYYVPFSDKDVSTKDYTLTIDWGDGKTQKIVPKTSITKELISHTYDKQQEYTITITSSEPDNTKEQIPDFKPGAYYTTSTSGQSSNKLLFKSLETPLLNTGATDFFNCFNGCNNLTGSIPTGLFDNNTNVTTFSSCFKGCINLTGPIPAGLFDKNTQVTTFALCFNGCSSLTGPIPAGLFDKNTQVTTFASCFSGCKGLTGSIPAGLFDNNTNVTTFASCFSGCKGLTGSIPAGLFSNNKQVTTFTYCFSGCTGLTGPIPAGLFDNNTNVTDFALCFNGCTSLTGSIPAGLFDNNTNVTTFTYCFSGCKGLTGSIPEKLFDKNRQVINFSYCFSGCTKLTLNSNIFCNETTDKGSRFSSLTKSINFYYCFNNVGSDASITDAGIAPALWDYTYGAGNSHTSCYIGVDKVSNAADIPTGWK